ncbi:GNAT family N-acetyltransferase [Amnibacterium sp. CER49]|uniref:GNAT family N-acetyltransferase n=1 Tax=Amnibacterium sp. CER49 TaxID=3039161 RepID=UPI00244ACE4D|nr:GNAT family N-acetyltransferase [Amnibacterium sp. CER49]MDH2445417.1 GNAT family N-acetyltransferase [Amnibacterium sp. CER49]
MTDDLLTEHLMLHAVDVDEARRIRGRTPRADDSWAHDYPFEGDVAGLGAFLHASERFGEQRPFGYYRISRRADGLAIGGIGFKGAPVDGIVEIGYGLAPSGRGHGYAAEALRAVCSLAAGLGVRLVRADTELDNLASQRTLGHAGFRVVSEDETLRYCELPLPEA